MLNELIGRIDRYVAPKLWPSPESHFTPSDYYEAVTLLAAHPKNPRGTESMQGAISRNSNFWFKWCPRRLDREENAGERNEVSDDENESRYVVVGHSVRIVARRHWANTSGAVDDAYEVTGWLVSCWKPPARYLFRTKTLCTTVSLPVPSIHPIPKPDPEAGPKDLPTVRLCSYYWYSPSGTLSAITS